MSVLIIIMFTSPPTPLLPYSSTPLLLYSPTSPLLSSTPLLLRLESDCSHH